MECISPISQASAAAIIDTATQRIATALFCTRADAVAAIANLKFQGFADANIDLFVADDLQQEPLETTTDAKHTVSIVRALTALGIPQDMASYYETDVRAGMALVTVIANERSIDALNILHGHSEEEMDRETIEPLQDSRERPLLNTVNGADIEKVSENDGDKPSIVDEIRKMAR